MGIVLLSIGAFFGGGISYFYFQKTNKELKNKLDKADKELLDIEYKNSERLKNIESELQSKINELKKLRGKNDSTEDRFDDLEFEVSKLKKVNQSIKEENDQLTSSIREYDMLFNAKKAEIEKLKNQLNK